MRRGFKYPQPQVRFASLLLFDKGNKMKTYEEIAKEYSKTWSGSEEEHIDMGESENENDLFLFLVELAEKREIVEISEYVEEATKTLEEEYFKKDISDNMVIAKTHILQIINRRLWYLFEDKINNKN